jgi:hypothetical protein
LCHPDMTIEQFRWDDGSSVPIPSGHGAHLCVDFSAVDSWVLQRALRPGERAFGPDGELRAGHEKYRFEMANSSSDID